MAWITNDNIILFSVCGTLLFIFISTIVCVSIKNSIKRYKNIEPCEYNNKINHHIKKWSWLSLSVVIVFDGTTLILGELFQLYSLNNFLISMFLAAVYLLIIDRKTTRDRRRLIGMPDADYLP